MAERYRQARCRLSTRYLSGIDFFFARQYPTLPAIERLRSAGRNPTSLNPPDNRWCNALPGIRGTLGGDMADPGTTELSANCAKLVAGSRVTLHGLTSRAGIGLNGLTGTTLGSANSAGRVPVRVTVQGSTATRGVVEEKLIREDNLQMAQDEQPMMVIIGSHKYVVSGRVLSKHEDTFFAAALRQQAHLGDVSSGELRISRANGQLYEHVFRFLNCWPAGELPLISHEVSAEMASALLDEADFLLLPAMAWLFSAHVVNAACLEREDLYNRQAEDAMRWLFARQRDAPELNNRHLGLVDLKAAARSAGRSTYPVCFSHISPAVDTSKLVGSSYEALESFREYYPGVIDALSACATDSACSWFVAGGSVVRCLLRDPRAGPFFASGDVDVFICAKGDAAENHATELSRRICSELEQKCHAVWITRTLFTINIRCRRQIEREGYPGTYKVWENFDVQIILRIYQSPSEVLCGFDVDCCCVGFGPESRNPSVAASVHNMTVWALPRALAAFKKSRTLLNPLHAWPRQPSYELRLAKYAARGFPVAVPGLLEVPSDDAVLQWQLISRLRLIKLRGGARLVHMDMALGLPENGTVPSCNPDYRGGRASVGPGYRGARYTPQDWEAAIHRTFGQRETAHESDDTEWSVRFPTLPTDYDQVMTIIKDPYGWIAANYNYAPENHPHDDTLKFIQVKLSADDGDDDDIQEDFDTAWALIADCERDDLHIPRLLTWSVLPRSREYMNMEPSFSELWMAYKAPLFDRAAATASLTDAEYGEPFLESFRNLALVA